MYEKLFSALNKAKVKYLIAGGLAVNLYGIERMTADIDIIIDLSPENAAKFVKAVNRLGLKPRQPVKIGDFLNEQTRKTWITEKNMLVFSLFDPARHGFLLDVIIDDTIEFSKLYSGKRVFNNGRIPLTVLSPKDLIEMKRKAGRPQDLADIHYLRAISNGNTK